ncbi:MAG TPA: glucarate dehydratase, partial [Opitutae bacterium]|nr:glucarate dehydratase [Opitutae bacterium]
SNSHLGVSLAAMVHLGACIPQLDYDLDTHYPWQSDEIVEGGRLPFKNGAIQVPDGPGLGVTINRAELDRLHQNYLKSGLSFRNDEAEMQKIEPGWKFKATRW